MPELETKVKFLEKEIYDLQTDSSKCSLGLTSSVKTDVELLKKELDNQKRIYGRLDVAIEKLTDVSNSIHRMLAVHEEKIAKQEEKMMQTEMERDNRSTEFSKRIDALHNRLTDTVKEIIDSNLEHHKDLNKRIECINDTISSRVGVLEKWRHIIIGGAIVIGFVLNKLISFSP
jgi:chromosome segregation ATPase